MSRSDDARPSVAARHALPRPTSPSTMPKNDAGTIGKVLGAKVMTVLLPQMTPGPHGTRTRGRVRRGGREAPRRRTLEPELAEPGMIEGAHAERPEEQPFVRTDRDVVDAGVTLRHESVGREAPVLVAVAAPPLAGAIPEFVDEAHG